MMFAVRGAPVLFVEPMASIPPDPRIVFVDTASHAELLEADHQHAELLGVTAIPNSVALPSTPSGDSEYVQFSATVTVIVVGPTKAVYATPFIPPLAGADRVTDPFPVALPPDTTVSPPGTTLHGHPAPAVTFTVTCPPVDGSTNELLSSEYWHDEGACVIVKA
jgi:hypothetical protein